MGIPSNTQDPGRTNHKRQGRQKTNLGEIKHLAHILLMLDPEPNEKFPFIVKHPFSDNSFVAVELVNGSPRIGNIVEDPEALKKWRKTMAGIIEQADSANEIYRLVTKPYRFGFLKYAMPYMSREDFSGYLADAWVTCEEPNRDPNFTRRQLIGLFKQADPHSLMTAEEYACLEALEGPVTVYRGVTPYNAGSVKSLSWTLSRETAEWFAHRFGEEGTVYEAQIDKAHILAMFTGRNESEVIVDPQHLMNITEAPAQDMGIQMKMK